MRQRLALGLPLGLLVLLSGCVSERHFVHDSWPFGNPNAPPPQSEMALRALGKTPPVTPIAPQAGDVWPGPVQPVPTIGEVEQQMNLPLGQGYTPSLPSPYPPGVTPPDNTDLSIPSENAPLTAAPSTSGGLPQDLPPAVPGHIRDGAD